MVKHPNFQPSPFNPDMLGELLYIWWTATILKDPQFARLLHDKMYTIGGGDNAPMDDVDPNTPLCVDSEPMDDVDPNTPLCVDGKPMDDEPMGRTDGRRRQHELAAVRRRRTEGR